MKRRLPFKRTRRSGDAGLSTGDEPEQASQSSNGERREDEPAAELPPAEIPAEEPGEKAPAEETPGEGKRRGRFRRAAKPPVVRPPSVNLSFVRRERRALLRERERRVRDLGGLLLEMYRRDQFREDLIVEHCAQAMGIENRIHELEAIIARATSRRAASGPHCACGAPLFFGARFCAICGRPTDLAATGELCARCLQPLAVGASFCASCGAAVGDGPAKTAEAGEQTITHAPPIATGEEQAEEGDE
jgi:hypothetical protein